MEEIAARREHRGQRDQSHQLGPSHPESPGLGRAAHLGEGGMERGDRDVGEIHRHLGKAVFLDEPSDGLDRLQRSGNHDRLARGVLDHFAGERISLPLDPAALADIEGHRVGPAGGGGVQIHIERHQEVPGPDDCRAALGVERRRPEVRLPGRFGHLAGQALVFTGPDGGQILSRRIGLGGFVEVHRNLELAPHPLRQPAGPFGGLLHGDSGDRHQGADVGGAHPRVRPTVLAHVDQVGGSGNGPERGLDHRSRLSGEGHHRAVGGLAGIDVKERRPFNRLDAGGNLPHDVEIPSRTEIRHTFDQPGHSDRR